MTGARFAAYKWSVTLAVGAVQWTVYSMLGALPLPRSTTLLETAADRAIPFWPWTTWFYLPIYAGIFVLATVGFRTRALFHGALACVVGNMVVAALGHALVPATYPRIVVHSPFASASLALLGFVQHIDPPGNVFPSLHVAHASVLALLLRRERAVMGAAAIVMAGLLALSTLTTKQHFIADVLAGLAMAAAGYALASRKLDARTLDPRKLDARGPGAPTPGTPALDELRRLG